jgi:hypothetical protein
MPVQLVAGTTDAKGKGESDFVIVQKHHKGQ